MMSMIKSCSTELFILALTAIMDFPELAENKEIRLLHKYFVNFQSIGLHDIFTKKRKNTTKSSVSRQQYLLSAKDADTSLHCTTMWN